MFTVEELAERVAAYGSERISLKQFEDWFEENSAGAYDLRELSDKCVAIDAALSQYYFDHIGETALKQELANAVRPFASHAERDVFVNVYHPATPLRAAVATAAAVVVLSIAPVNAPAPSACGEASSSTKTVVVGSPLENTVSARVPVLREYAVL